MALVKLQEVTKQFDIRLVFKEIEFHIDKDERVAIVGQNGSGKSTLMKIVADLMEPDTGKRIAQNLIQIEMLPQHPEFHPELTVRQAIESELKGLNAAKSEYETVSLQLAEDYENKELLRRQSELTTFLDCHNAWDLDNKLERMLQEFDLKQFEHKNVNLLSGGEQKRVALAGLILKKPDILLLDEPTNHLDVQMVEFLEEFLTGQKYTLLFISHDRYFIDHLATRTVEIENHTIRSFTGGYQSYLQKKEELLKSMAKEHENLLHYLKQEEEWLRRGVRARLKRNEGRKARVMDLREQAKKNPSAIRKMKVELEREKKHFNRAESVNRKKLLFEVEDISKNLGDKNLIAHFSTRILQKDRIAIVGKNGSGKSTFLKLLLGRQKVDAGKIKTGDLTFGYFDQHREMLDNSKNLIETFCPHGGDRVDVCGKNMHVYGYLKNFLFPREYLDKKIGVLSGGEKNRVALALLFTKQVDCLILDEPTNDLDIPTINILEEKLLNFSGALLFVSHDRYFVDKIAQKMFVFKGQGEVEESHRSYSEYLELEKEIRQYDQMEREIQKEETKVEKPKNRPNKLSYKDQREYDALPGTIELMEQKIEELKQCLSDPRCYEETGIAKVAEDLKKVEEEYEEKVERFLEIEEKIEEINAFRENA